VVLAHAKHVRAISHAKIKTDKVDARVLADLLAADLVPAVWTGDERSRSLPVGVAATRAGQAPHADQE
jgi:transposase